MAIEVGEAESDVRSPRLNSIQGVDQLLLDVMDDVIRVSDDMRGKPDGAKFAAEIERIAMAGAAALLGHSKAYEPDEDWNRPGAIDAWLASNLQLEDTQPKDRVASVLVTYISETMQIIREGSKRGTDWTAEAVVDCRERWGRTLLGIPDIDEEAEGMEYATVDELFGPITQPVQAQEEYCPTGAGGGIDPTCSPLDRQAGRERIGKAKKKAADSDKATPNVASKAKPPEEKPAAEPAVPKKATPKVAKPGDKPAAKADAKPAKKAAATPEVDEQTGLNKHLSKWLDYQKKTTDLPGDLEEFEKSKKTPHDALSTYLSGGFVDMNADPNHEATKKMRSLVQTIPPTEHKGDMYRVLGFADDKARDAFLASIEQPQAKSFTSWAYSDGDPTHPKATPMNNIGLDLASQFGDKLVVLRHKDASGSGAKDVSFAYSGPNTTEATATKGGELILGNGHQLRKIGQKVEGDKVIVDVETVKPGAHVAGATTAKQEATKYREKEPTLESWQRKRERMTELVEAFCPTGKKGGVDNSCAPKGGKAKGKPPAKSKQTKKASEPKGPGKLAAAAKGTTLRAFLNSQNAEHLGPEWQKAGVKPVHGDEYAHADMPTSKLYASEYDSWDEPISDPEHVARLAAKFKAGEAIKPILVHLDPSGEAQVLDGHHRAKAAMEAGISNIPVVYSAESLAKIWKDANAERLTPEQKEKSPRTMASEYAEWRVKMATPAAPKAEKKSGGENAGASKKIADWAAKKFGDPQKAEAFAKWFGDSKVVDSNGHPMVMYHGTAADFNEFKPSNTGALGPGIYFAPDRSGAEEWAKRYDGAVVKEVYIKASKPLIIDNTNEAPEKVWARFEGKDDAETMQNLRKAGYDAVWATGTAQTKWGTIQPELMVFEPTQIKSVDNKGTFSPDTGDINEAFCPTGKGGKVDNSCSPKKKGTGKSKIAEKRKAELEKIRAETKVMVKENPETWLSAEEIAGIEAELRDQESKRYDRALRASLARPGAIRALMEENGFYTHEELVSMKQHIEDPNVQAAFERYVQRNPAVSDIGRPSVAMYEIHGELAQKFGQDHADMKNMADFAAGMEKTEKTIIDRQGSPEERKEYIERNMAEAKEEWLNEAWARVVRSANGNWITRKSGGEIEDRELRFRTGKGSQFTVTVNPRGKMGGEQIHSLSFQDENGSYQITGAAGAAEALEVFKKVSGSTASYIDHYKPGLMYFSAMEGNRAQLYDRLVRTSAAVNPDYVAYRIPNASGDGDGAAFVLGRRDNLEAVELAIQGLGYTIGDEPGDEIAVKITEATRKVAYRLQPGVDDAWFEEDAWKPSEKGAKPKKVQESNAPTTQTGDETFHPSNGGPAWRMRGDYP